jgi:hypothetical protein
MPPVTAAPIAKAKASHIVSNTLRRVVLSSARPWPNLFDRHVAVRIVNVSDCDVDPSAKAILVSPIISVCGGPLVCSSPVDRALGGRARSLWYLLRHRADAWNIDGATTVLAPNPTAYFSLSRPRCIIIILTRSAAALDSAGDITLGGGSGSSRWGAHCPGDNVLWDAFLTGDVGDRGRIIDIDCLRVPSTHFSI